jgi:hypothetical protein
MEAESPITTSHPHASKSGVWEPKLLLRRARSHGTLLRVAVGEGEALPRKGWLV